MPAERKLSIEIEGKKHEIAVPAEFLHKDDLAETHVEKGHFQTELDSRVKSITKGLRKPEDLLKDDDFMKSLVDARRPELTKLLDVKVDPEHVTKIQTEAMDKVRREELEPIKAGIATRDTEIAFLRERNFDAQVVEAAAKLRVVPDLLDLVKVHVRKSFVWNPEHKQFFQKKEGGREDEFELSADPKKGGYPYATVSEFMDRLSRDSSKKAWFEAGNQPGPGYKGGKPGDPRAVSLEDYNKMSPSEKTAWAIEHPAEFETLMKQLSTAGEHALLSK